MRLSETTSIYGAPYEYYGEVMLGGIFPQQPTQKLSLSARRLNSKVIELAEVIERLEQNFRGIDPTTWGRKQVIAVSVILPTVFTIDEIVFLNASDMIRTFFVPLKS